MPGPVRDAAARLSVPGAARRRGETLVECLVAVALVAAVALPALAAMRGALAAASGAGRRAAAASAARFRARSAAALLRFGEDVPPLSVTETPVRVVCRTAEDDPEGRDAPPARRATAEADGAPPVRIEALPPLFREPTERTQNDGD